MYTPPRVSGTPEILLEQDLLTQSVVVGMHFDTSYQEVEYLDYEAGDAYTNDYNYLWD